MNQNNEFEKKKNSYNSSDETYLFFLNIANSEKCSRHTAFLNMEPMKSDKDWWLATIFQCNLRVVEMVMGIWEDCRQHWSLSLIQT